MNLKDKEKNEYEEKHKLFIEKYQSRNLCLCPYNVNVYQTLINFKQSPKDKLLIYGNSGIGKTHLIAFFITRECNNSIYIDTSSFIETIYDYLKINKSFQDLIDWILTHDLIVFDCFHLTQEKEKVNKVFKQLTKKLNGQKLILIWTTNNPKENIPNLYESINFPVPDKESLKSISTQFINSNSKNLKLTNQALDLLIESIPPNISILFNKIVEFFLIQESPNSLNLIKEEKIKNILNKAAKTKNSPDQKTELLIQNICKKLDFDDKDIFSKTRTKDVVNKRNIVIYLIKKLTNLSHQEIGDIFNKNHSTITHSIKQVENKMNDKSFREYLKIFL